MKLSKTSWFMLIGGILIIAFAGLGMAYSQQSQDQGRLAQELAQAQLILAKSSPEALPPQKAELEKKLAERQSQIEALKVELSPLVQSIESSESLFHIAADCNVEIVGIRSTAPSTDKLGGANYSILQFSVRLEGEVADIINFIHAWSQENTTGVVKSVRINVPELTEEAPTEVESGGEGESVEQGGTAGEEEAVEEGGTAGQTSEEPSSEGEGGEEAAVEPEPPSGQVELVIYTLLG